MESKVIRCFLPDLVTAVSDCVHSVSDRCLAEGLIPDSTYRRVLESRETSEDKTRYLLLAVIKSTETNSRCFGILLNILEQVLPHGTRGTLLSAIKKELTEQAECDMCTVTSVVAMGQNQSQAPPLTSGEIIKYQTSLFSKLEDVIRQHEHACAERKSLEENLKSKEEENERLKNELENLKLNQTTDLATKKEAMLREKEMQFVKENEMALAMQKIASSHRLNNAITQLPLPPLPVPKRQPYAVPPTCTLQSSRVPNTRTSLKKDRDSYSDIELYPEYEDRDPLADIELFPDYDNSEPCDIDF